MKKFFYVVILLFVLMLGLQMGNDVHNNGLQGQINRFEESIEKGEDLSFNHESYYIEGNVINKVAKKSESVVKSLVEKFKDFLK